MSLFQEKTAIHSSKHTSMLDRKFGIYIISKMSEKVNSQPLSPEMAQMLADITRRELAEQSPFVTFLGMKIPRASLNQGGNLLPWMRTNHHIHISLAAPIS
jgi:hypothetical protein